MTEKSEKPVSKSASEGSADDGPKWGKMALPAFSGAVGGMIASFVVVKLFRAEAFGALGTSETAAILVGLLYTMVATGIGVGLVSPAFGSRFLNVEDADELREQRRVLTASAGGMLALGLALAVLAISGPESQLSVRTGGIVFTGLLLAGVLLTLRSAKYADELMRAISRETGNAGYYLITLIVGGWAALAHLQIAPAPAMLDIISTMWALGLIAALIASGKRGMLAPR